MMHVFHRNEELYLQTVVSTELTNKNGPGNEGQTGQLQPVRLRHVSSVLISSACSNSEALTENFTNAGDHRQF